MTRTSRGGGGMVEALVLDRLADSDLPSEVADLVMAALLGDDQLAAAVAGVSTAPPVQLATGQSGAATRSLDCYLAAITVEGFRGVGRRQTLRLTPGPGFTMVVGRNGSGKSSFAEAVELAMTGDSKRWSGRRSVVWREGWRNLHAPDPCRIEIELAMDGAPGATSLVREWAPGAGLDEATSHVQPRGKPRRPVTALGWDRPLEVYRPFLSYSELGALIDGRPSEMYDAVQAILGLDHLVDTERRLTDARRRLDGAAKAARQSLPPILERLRMQHDPRAQAALAALSGGTWDLDAAEAVATGAETADDPDMAWLRRVADLTLPDRAAVEAAAASLATAAERAARGSGSPAVDARRVLGLLRGALEHRRAHPGEPCPVCAGKPLDDAWAVHARTEVDRLRRVAAEADAVAQAVDDAVRTLHALAAPAPALLAASAVGEVDAVRAREAWQGWHVVASGITADSVAAVDGDAVLGSYDEARRALADLQAKAAAELRRRVEAWQPVAAELAGWLASARGAQDDLARLHRVKSALNWLRPVGQDVRDRRMAPFSKLSAAVWEALRQGSNVDLGEVRLEGSATRRQLSLDVTVDGFAGAALGVMSQGELHALGLALFLPRATTEDSPFRFVVIDDPVQSMDPAKVDGLAKLLARVARTRQVLVLTHDDRLAESVRRQQFPATIWEVVRRPGSVVELRKSLDPVQRYLGDARALALTADLSVDARAVVVAGLCRSAIEAACHEVVRSRRLAGGAPHADVERDLARAQTLHQAAALALFDDPDRAGDVVGRLNSFGRWAGDAFVAARNGTHAVHSGDLVGFVRDAGRLCARLRQ